MSHQAIVQGAGRIAVHGVAWSLVWAVAIFIIGNIILQIDPDSIDPGEEPIRMAGMVAPVGAASGLVFGILLALLERGRSLADASLVQVLLCSIIAGAALPLLTPMNNHLLVNTIPLGMIAATLSAGTTRWIRRRTNRSPAIRRGRLDPVS
jgi:hypothetical protein